MPKKKPQTSSSPQPAPSQTSPSQTSPKSSTAIVVTMKNQMKDALQRSADANLKSLSGQAVQYILEGLKRDGLLPLPQSPQQPSQQSSHQPQHQPSHQPGPNGPE